MTDNEVRSLRAALEQLRGEVAREVTALKTGLADFKAQRLARDDKMNKQRSANITLAVGLVVTVLLAFGGGVLLYERRTSSLEATVEFLGENFREGMREIKSDVRDIRNGQRSQLSRQSLRKEARAD